MKAYTYLIGWPDHNKWYYGVRYAKGSDPADLWNPYTTSSNLKLDLRNYARHHGNKCKRNSPNSVGITDKAVYNNLVGNI